VREQYVCHIFMLGLLVII